MDKGIILVVIFVLGLLGAGIFLLQVGNDVENVQFIESPSQSQPVVIGDREDIPEPNEGIGRQAVELPEGERILLSPEEEAEIAEAEEEESRIAAEREERQRDLEERNRQNREAALAEVEAQAAREEAERENARAKLIEGIEGRAREQNVCNSECLEMREREKFVNACLEEWIPVCDVLVPQAKNFGFVVSDVLEITEFVIPDEGCVGLLESRARNTNFPVSCGFSDPSVLIMPSGEYFMYINRFDYVDKEDALLLYTSADALNWELKSDPLDAVVFADVTMAMAKVTEDGGVRIYYSIPAGNEDEGSIGSAYSVNGVDSWVFEGALFGSIDGNDMSGPEVIMLDSGSFVMYFGKEITMSEDLSAETTLTEIGSAASVDGKNWVLNEGSSLVFSDDYEGMNKVSGATGSILGKVLNPGIVKLDDGRFLMVYTASSIHPVCGNFNCTTLIPVVTEELWAATSEDGIVWKKIGSLGLRGSDATVVSLGENRFRVYAGDVDATRGILTDEIESRWVSTFIITVE